MVVFAISDICYGKKICNFWVIKAKHVGQELKIGNEGQEENENSKKGNKCSVLSLKDRRK